MKTITITFEDNTVTVTDGRHTEASVFNKMSYEPKQALIALAEFYGYDPAGIFCFDEDEDMETNTDTKRHYPCDTEPFQCPFNARYSEDCHYYCGLGVDESEAEE